MANPAFSFPPVKFEVPARNANGEDESVLLVKQQYLPSEINLKGQLLLPPRDMRVNSADAT